MIKEVKNFSRLPRGCKVPFYQFASLCLATDYHSATFMCKWFRSILLYQTNWSSFEQIMGRSGMDTIGSVRIPTSFVTQFSPNSTLPFSPISCLKIFIRLIFIERSTKPNFWVLNGDQHFSYWKLFIRSSILNDFLFSTCLDWFRYPFCCNLRFFVLLEPNFSNPPF